MTENLEFGKPYQKGGGAGQRLPFNDTPCIYTGPNGSIFFSGAAYEMMGKPKLIKVAPYQNKIAFMPGAKENLRESFSVSIAKNQCSIRSTRLVRWCRLAIPSDGLLLYTATPLDRILIVDPKSSPVPCRFIFSDSD